MKSEPVLTAGAIAGVVMAFLGMAVSLGWLRLDEGQMQAIQAFVLPALGLALPIAAAFYARSKVTPTADPKTSTGEPAALVPVAQLQAMGFAPDDPRT
jgi:apolipoprotein N-acyltransferase